MVERTHGRRGRGRPPKDQQLLVFRSGIEEKIPNREKIPLGQLSGRDLWFELSKVKSDISVEERTIYTRVKSKLERIELIEVELQKRKEFPPTFSSEAREALQEKGYKICILKGESLQSLINNVEEGIYGSAVLFLDPRFEDLYPFKMHHDYLRYLERYGTGEGWDQRTDKIRIVSDVSSEDPIEAMHSEVAINLRQPFLQDSNNKNQLEQAIMVREFSEDIKQRIPGVEAIIGDLPDYGELVLRHLYPNGDNFSHLLDSTQEYCYIRTHTPGRGPYTVDLSITNPNGGPIAKVSHIDSHDDRLWVAPVVVPAK